jgi:hypothetical protein
MVELKVRHEDYPDGAAAEALKCLKRANVNIDGRELYAERILISADDPKLFDAAIAALKAARFSVGHPHAGSRPTIVRPG